MILPRERLLRCCRRVGWRLAPAAAFCLILLLVVSASGLAASTVFELGPAGDEYPVRKQVRYSFTVQNKKAVPVPQADLWVAAPVRQSSLQCCTRLEVSHGAELAVDNAGNQVLHVDLRGVAPYGAVIITVRADVMLAGVPARFGQGDISSFQDPEPGIESASPEILALARKLKAGTPALTARKSYEWVSGNLENAGYVRNNRGALCALRTGKGDCTEYASLFVALCRAAGVAARVMGGYVCEENGILTRYDYHNWAEFFDGRDWRLADPFRRVFDDPRGVYVAMNIEVRSDDASPLGEGQLFRVKGEGLKAHMGD